MKGQSDTKPESQLKSRGKTQVLYNIIQKDVTDELTHITKTVWEYDYVEIDGAVTKAKVMEAMQRGGAESDTSEIVPGYISTQYNDARNELALSTITKITYAQADAYIDDNVKDLASARAYLKKLTIVVLAMLKQTQ